MDSVYVWGVRPRPRIKEFMDSDKKIAFVIGLIKSCS